MKKALISVIAAVTAITMSVNCFAFDTIKKGDKGDNVKEVQELLIAQGYLEGDADGAFGAKTEAAVLAFQQAKGLDATGIVGEGTLNALKESAGDSGDASNEGVEAEAAEPSSEAGDAEVAEASETEGTQEPEPEDVFIKKEFLYQGYSDTSNYVVVKNNLDKDVSVQINSVAKGADSKMIGAGTASIEVLSPGAETVCYTNFDSTDKADIASVETSLTYSDSKYYKGINNDLEAEVSDTGDKIVVALTNKGDDAAQFVEGYAFFFAGDECVGQDWLYFVDDDSEIKPGATIVNEMSYYNWDGPSYDRYELYFDGRADN